MENNLRKILVLGATGKTGSRVAQRLNELKVQFRAGSRNASPGFDWADQSTWKNAVEDIHTVYISFQPDLAVPGAVQTIQKFCDLAKERGVEKLVLLSGRGEKEAVECEQIVQTSGLKWTICRASWFNQNFSESFLLDPILEGTVALPLADLKEPFVDVDDIADVVVASLTEEGHDGKLYELTGPRLLSFREAVNEIAIASGRNIEYLDISIEEFRKYMHEVQIPEDFIWLITYLFTEMTDRRNESIANGVEEALKRKPKDFTVYAQQVAESGVWNQSQAN